MTFHRTFVGIGSNLHGPRQQVGDAINQFNVNHSVQLVNCSSFYLTKPWGNNNQPNFVNAVVELHTKLSPKELLELLQSFELKAGRIRSTEHKWSARILDLDILLFDNIILSTPELTIPHPYMTKRIFALAPLLELDEDIVIPGHGKACKFLSNLDQSEIQRIEN